MIKFNDYFDDFTFHARIMPVIVASIPLFAFALYKGIVISGIKEGISYTIFIIAFIAFAARVCREFGKKYENKMYSQLGAMPTTIILRYSDCRIDNLTKTRYHEKLNQHISNIVLPLCPEKDADMQYITAINWLRKYANTNRDKELRVYQELKEYNFWRNLYGIKNVCILVYGLVAFREIIYIKNFSIKELLLEPYPVYIAFILMLISLFVFVILVNKNTVKEKAFDYARTLLEVCDNI